MPDHKRFIVVYFEGFLYLDHNVPFGLGSASGIQGEIADATVDIWYSLDVHPVVKWVDDFTIFRFPRLNGPFSDGPFNYAYDLKSVKHMISPLGVPWHPTKGQDFAYNFSYIGFEWDLTTKSVQLSTEKRIKHIAKVSVFLSQSLWRASSFRLVSARGLLFRSTSTSSMPHKSSIRILCYLLESPIRSRLSRFSAVS